MRQYKGKRIDNGEWVYGWYVEISGRYLIVTNKATLVVGNNYWFSLKGFTEVDPATVEFNVGELWFNVELFEKMAMQSREYKKELLDK